MLQPIVDLAMLLRAGLFIVYVLMDWLTALVLTALYSATYFLCPIVMDWLGGSALLMVVSGVVITAAALAVQVLSAITLESKGEHSRDDSKKESDIFHAFAILLLSRFVFYAGL